MRLMLRSGFAAVVGLVLLAPMVTARVIAPFPVPQRAALADAVILGKVSSIEDRPITIDKADYRVAVVRIEDGLFGTNDLTHLRIAFQPPGGGINRFPHLNLQVGQEACFFLTKVKGENAFRFRMYFDVVNKENPSFKTDVEWAKKCGKVLKDVDGALKSKTGESRLLAAAMLVYRYRNPGNSAGKQEPIDAVQSKLILEALADADWKTADFQSPLNPQSVFYQLPDKEKFGWVNPRTGMLGERAPRWLKDNADKYRIQRFVQN